MGGLGLTDEQGAQLVKWLFGLIVIVAVMVFLIVTWLRVGGSF